MTTERSKFKEKCAVGQRQTWEIYLNFMENIKTGHCQVEKKIEEEKIFIFSC